MLWKYVDTAMKLLFCFARLHHKQPATGAVLSDRSPHFNVVTRSPSASEQHKRQWASYGRAAIRLPKRGRCPFVDHLYLSPVRRKERVVIDPILCLFVGQSEPIARDFVWYFNKGLCEHIQTTHIHTMATAGENDKKQLYGWFSAECATKRGYVIIYSMPVGGQVTVTSVSSSRDKRGSFHDDVRLVGPVAKYARTINDDHPDYALGALECVMRLIDLRLESGTTRISPPLAPQGAATPMLKMRRRRQRREPTCARRHAKRPEDRRRVVRSRGCARQ
nr:hypothetical protein [Pandoravirus massiliensis]